MAGLADSVMATDSINNATTSASEGTFTVPTSGSDGPWLIYRIAVTQGTYIRYDGTTVTSSNGEFWPAGQVEYRKIPLGATIRHIQDVTAGRITFSRVV